MILWRLSTLVFGAVLTLLLTSCNSEERSGAGVVSDVTFERTQLEVSSLNGPIKIQVEVAATEEQRARGLMFRESMPEKEGMVFVMEHARQAGFWMRNTRLPLSIAYIHANGRILEIHPLEPFSPDTVYSRSTEVSYALEMNRGWFKKNQVPPGAQISGLPSKNSTASDSK